MTSIGLYRRGLVPSPLRAGRAEAPASCPRSIGRGRPLEVTETLELPRSKKSPTTHARWPGWKIWVNVLSRPGTRAVGGGANGGKRAEPASKSENRNS